jgi:hypothetical protein
MRCTDRCKSSVAHSTAVIVVVSVPNAATAKKLDTATTADAGTADTATVLLLLLYARLMLLLLLLSLLLLLLLLQVCTTAANGLRELWFRRCCSWSYRVYHDAYGLC